MDRIDCDRMFVAVLDAGSFADAARRLGTSSGQASKLVARLEADLGVQLIKRTTRALAATEVGRAYYERMKVLLEEFDALDGAVRNASGAPAGRLRVTAPVSFGTAQLVPLLIEFARAFPAIQLEVSFSDRVVHLVEEGFDVGIRIGQPDDSSLIARKLCDARIIIVAASDYIERFGAPAAPEDLAAHRCIVDTNFREPLLWRFAGHGGGEPLDITVAGRLYFSNAEACLRAAEAGLGVARVPSFIGGPRVRDGHVRALLGAFESPRYSVYAVYPPARHLAVKVRSLVDFLVDSFRGEPAWDRGWG